MNVFVNGSLVSADQAVISVFDHGFLYGYGLFETIRAYQGKMFLFEQHYDRLKSAAELYSIKMQKTTSELAHDIYLTMASNQLQDAYIRVTFSGGIGGLGLWGEEHETPSWVIMTKPITTLPSTKRLVPLSLSRAGKEAAIRAKSLSFGNNMLAKKELHQRGESDAEGLFLDDLGNIVEGTVSNIFFVRNGIVHTPSQETGLLNGVTRSFIIGLCHRNQIEINEGFFKLTDIFESEEVFITNSIQELVPVDQIGERRLSIKGPITRLLMESYKQSVSEMVRGEKT